MDGSSALAAGAVEAGLAVVTGYPGAPSGAVFAALAAQAAAHGHLAEWCVNERVALDMACGVSQGGKRALVCVKGVGLNVGLDTLMHLNMTGVHGGLVILLGDDPSAWGSGNEQDTRPVAPLAELPLFEPATPQEGRRLLRWAFDFSEEMRLPLIVRITRSFGQRVEAGPPPVPPAGQPTLGPDREPQRWVAGRRNAVANHRRLHQALQRAAERTAALPFDQLAGSGRLGILAGGFAHAKLLDAATQADLSKATVLKLSTLYPLPRDLVGRFLRGVDSVLVLEEVDPYLEDAIKVVGYDVGAAPPIFGKRTGHVNWEGELFRWHIQQALEAYLPGFAPARRYAAADWEQEKPYRKQHLAAGPYAGILAALRDEAAALGLNPFVAADPSGAVQAAQHLDTKLNMGSAVGVAMGLRRAGVSERAVAVTGDSNFYHGALNALIQASASGADLLLLVLDNGGAWTTGGQATPDRGLPLPSGERGPRVGICELAQAAGVESVWTVEEDDDEARLRAVLRAALLTPGLGLVLVRIPSKPVD